MCSCFLFRVFHVFFHVLILFIFHFPILPLFMFFTFLTHTYIVLRQKQTAERNHHDCAEVLKVCYMQQPILVVSSKQAHDTKMTN